MFARTIFSIAGLIGVGCIFYGFWYEEEIIARIAIPFVVIAAVFYVLSPQVNWWWYNKKPSEVDTAIKQMLSSRLPFYRNLSEENKEKFEKRVSLFLMAKEYTPKVHDEVPEDIKAVIAACAVQMTFNREEYLFDTYEQFIIYPHPFPTPQYESWHICENYEEDGVILFSAEHLLHGFFEPQKYYNIGLHEYANIYLKTYPNEKYPVITEENWKDFERMSNFPPDKTKKYIGLESINPLAVAITLFFTHSPQFKAFLPKEYEMLETVFLK